LAVDWKLLAYHRIAGEKLVCEFRKMSGPYLIAKTSGRRAQRVALMGLPAEAWIEKPIRLKERG
jgi:hypothetical protein